MEILKKLLDLLIGPQPLPLYSRPSERQLIHEELKVGRQIFGAAPQGRKREFFCLDATTWIWHEEWLDPFTGQKRSTMLRYEVRPNGVLKTRNNENPVFIEGEELTNLVNATRMYFEQVVYHVYRYDPNTGYPLPREMVQGRASSL